MLKPYLVTNIYALWNDDFVVVANSKSEALGIALEHDYESIASEFEITPVDITKVGVTVAYE